LSFVSGPSKKIIEKVTGVTSANVSYKNKSAAVFYDDQLTNLANIQEAKKNVVILRKL